MIVYEANSAKMTLQSLLLSFVRIESKFICSVHLHIFIYTFEVQKLSILRKYFKIFHADSWQPLKKVAFSRHRNYKKKYSGVKTGYGEDII